MTKTTPGNESRAHRDCGHAGKSDADAGWFRGVSTLWLLIVSEN
jgi:hypothetical protein